MKRVVAKIIGKKRFFFVDYITFRLTHGVCAHEKSLIGKTR